ncbi:MAG: TonB-dependent receptor, partial [Dysgonamonadaceae bacterium]|nr:TonB-dependent receptor [Dysgonamonadaceae bacterium]
MRIFTAFLLVFFCQSAICQYSLSGKILNVKTNVPIEYAYIKIVDRDRWTVADNKGEFHLKNVEKGEINLLVSALGYAKKTFSLHVAENRTDLVFYLPEDNLQLNEVVVTAIRKTDEMATTWLIDRAGIEHLQVIGISDFMSLLPGGQTNRNQHLATGSAQLLAVRGTTSEHGNPTFGTAIEVDGIRLSNNASFGTSTSSIGEVYGVDTRNIATGAIESVEIITGIPSVEYGDLSNG